MVLTAPDVTESTIQLHELADKVRGLSARVEDLEQRRLQTALVEFDRLIDLQMEVQSFTENLFANSASVQPWQDEETGERHFIVHATAVGGVDDVVRLNHKWHQQIGDVAGDLALKFRLSLSFA